jgi:2-oxoglutarate dehydrogenase E2 component (dihydrolipoamide succinyltransferase)
MAVSVTMPRLGESVSEGTVTRWLKQEGDQVEADEPLLEVSTDKVDTEIPAPASGVLQSIKVSEDETVEVGVELAVIGDADESGGEASDAGGATQEADEAEEDQAEQGQAEEQAEQEQAEQEQAEQEQAEEEEPEGEPEPAQAEAPAQRQPEQEQPEQERSEPEPAPAGQAQTQQSGSSQQSGSTQQSAQQTAGSDGEAPYVTPLVRRLAAEHNVDLGSVTGTGVGGRIRKQDVLDAAAKGGGGQQAAQEAPEQEAEQQEAPKQEAPKQEAPKQEAPAQRSGESAPAKEKTSEPAPSSPDTRARGRTEKLSRLRTVIATRMVESLQVSAQLTTVVEVDVTRIARLRERAKTSFEQREGVKLSFLPFFAIATCEALKQHPKVNASIDLEQGTVTYHDAEHLGVAVDTERGLLVPVIRDAGDLNLGGMARKISDLAERTRRNEVTPDELGGGTFTLTNTGSRGALFDTPIINQPQVGILGTGTVVKRPEVLDDPELGEIIAIRSSMYLALTYDHRIVDGADAARFLATIKHRLEDGAFEGDLGL